MGTHVVNISHTKFPLSAVLELSGVSLGLLQWMKGVMVWPQHSISVTWKQTLCVSASVKCSDSVILSFLFKWAVGMFALHVNTMCTHCSKCKFMHYICKLHMYSIWERVLKNPKGIIYRNKDRCNDFLNSQCVFTWRNILLQFMLTQFKLCVHKHPLLILGGEREPKHITIAVYLFVLT